MIICSCHAVSDRTIKTAIAEGASSVEEVTAKCGAGACCGACRDVIGEMVTDPSTRESHDACRTRPLRIRRAA